MGVATPQVPLPHTVQEPRPGARNTDSVCIGVSLSIAKYMGLVAVLFQNIYSSLFIVVNKVYTLNNRLIKEMMK